MFQNILLPVGGREDVMRVLDMIAPDAWNDIEIAVLPAETGSPLDAASLNDAASLGDDVSQNEAESLVEDAPAGLSVRAPKRAWPLLWFGLKRASLQVLPHHRVEIRRGFMTRHLVLMPLERAQSVALTRPALHKFLGLASVQVQTVAGPVSVYVRGLGSKDANEALSKLSEQMIEAQKA